MVACSCTPWGPESGSGARVPSGTLAHIAKSTKGEGRWKEKKF